MPPRPGGSPKFFLKGGSTPWHPIPTPTRVMSSLLNALHPSNYIGCVPKGQRVEPPVRACKNLAPDTCGIKIRLG